MELFCGIDWAESHHDVALVDADGTKVAKISYRHWRQGFQRPGVAARRAQLGAELGAGRVETDKNLIVVALLAAGHTVCANNPRAVARYRERHHQAGGKSDPGDAAVLANILRTDRHGHRAMPDISEAAPSRAGVGPPTPRGHLGPPADREPAALGIARVLSRRLGCLPHLDPQSGSRDPRRHPNPLRGPQAYPQAGGHPAATRRER